jgi:RNA polymerase sigma-70 factor (ECF subfamily)
MKMCGDEEDAKDIAQETLMALAKGVRDFRGEASLSTWLYTVARRFCIKKRRRSKHAPTEQASLDDATRAPVLLSRQRPPDDEVAGQQLGRALDAAIRAIDPEKREVLVLRDVEGLSAAEVAEVLGISVEATKSRLHRARLEVRRALAPLLDPPAHPVAAPGTCPDVLTLFSQHAEGDISAERCAEMERHLAACPRCTAACDGLKRTLALCRAAPVSDGPVPSELADAVRAAVRAARDPAEHPG